jgi:predicted RNase H-like HicB family nuclease
MQIPVLITAHPENGFSARAGAPFGFTVEGKTREETLRKVREMIEQTVSSTGSELVHVDVPSSDHPWLRIAGSLDPNDPEVQEWQRIIEENRRKADEDPNYP